MIIKSYIFEKNFRENDKYKCILFYGENEGIKDDLKNKIKEENSNSEIINIFQDEILKNNNLLFDNLANPSLFNERKIIFLHEVNDKIYDTINESFETKFSDTKLYIFSKNLEKRSKLRNLFEKEGELAIVACYADNDRTIYEYTQQKLKNFKGVNAEIINLIIQNSNSNREIIIKEVEKIKTFFLDKQINQIELKELLNIKTVDDFELIRDAALSGNKAKVNKLLEETQFVTEENYLYINQLNQRLQKLMEINIAKEQNQNLDFIMNNLKPKIFWKDKPIITNQLTKWNCDKLKAAINKVSDTEVLMKKNSNLNKNILIKNLMLDLCLSASNS